MNCAVIKAREGDEKSTGLNGDESATVGPADRSTSPPLGTPFKKETFSGVSFNPIACY